MKCESFCDVNEINTLKKLKIYLGSRLHRWKSKEGRWKNSSKAGRDEKIVIQQNFNLQGNA